jgi:hypothetical protein
MLPRVAMPVATSGCKRRQSRIGRAGSISVLVPQVADGALTRC